MNHIAPSPVAGNPVAPSLSEFNPVDLWGHFNPPPLPKGLVPKVVEDFAYILGEHMGADPAGLAMAALTVLGAAIPDRIHVRVKKHDATWTECARIWTALVGPPSTKKSPILSAAVRPLAKLDAQLVRYWQQEWTQWNALTKEERKEVPEPLQRRLRIEDTTIEAAQEVLKGSPDGVLCYQDELSGFFGAMEKYSGGKGAGADRSFWLRAFNGGEYALNRIGRGITLIPNASVSLLGGIQPEPIRKISADAQDDGLLQRLFPIVLRPATVGHDWFMPPATAMYEFTVGMCSRAIPPLGNLVFDDGAQAVRRELEAKHLRLMTAEIVSRKLSSHVGKLDGLFARLCVIWHVVENCAVPLPAMISEGVARRVAAFMERFLLPHAACFYSSILGLGDDHERLQAIAAYILAHGLRQVTNREVQRGDRAMRKIANADIRPLLEQLAALNWLSADVGLRGSDPIWTVNPEVHRLFAERGAREKSRKDEARKTLAEIFSK